MTEPSESHGSVFQGLILCCGINLILVVVGCNVAWIEAERPGGSNSVVHAAIVIVLSIGLLQLLYLIPLWRILKTSGKTQTIKGVMIAACVTAFLNAAWLVFKALQ